MNSKSILIIALILLVVPLVNAVTINPHTTSPLSSSAVVSNSGYGTNIKVNYHQFLNNVTGFNVTVFGGNMPTYWAIWENNSVKVKNGTMNSICTRSGSRASCIFTTPYTVHLTVNNFTIIVLDTTSWGLNYSTSGLPHNYPSSIVNLSRRATSNGLIGTRPTISATSINEVDAVFGILTTNFTIAAADTTPPAVFDVRPKSTANYVMNQLINISANVTDNVAVSAVRANVTKPGGLGTSSLILKLSSLNPKYNNTFRVPNQTGRYNVSFYANDTSNNKNWTVKTYFMVPTTVMITSTTPPNSTQYKVSPIFKANISTNALTMINCTLNIVGVVNQTQTKSLTSPTNVSYTPTFTTSGVYNYTINCNLLATGYQANSTRKTIFFDNVNPSFATNFKDNATYYNTSVIGYFNISDDFLLHNFNVTVDNIRFYGAALSGKTYKVNFSMSNYSWKPNINHNLSLIVADGHGTNLNIVTKSYHFKIGDPWRPYFKTPPTNNFFINSTISSYKFVMNWTNSSSATAKYINITLKNGTTTTTLTVYISNKTSIPFTPVSNQAYSMNISFWANTMYRQKNISLTWHFIKDTVSPSTQSYLTSNCNLYTLCNFFRLNISDNFVSYGSLTNTTQYAEVNGINYTLAPDTTVAGYTYTGSTSFPFAGNFFINRLYVRDKAGNRKQVNLTNQRFTVSVLTQVLISVVDTYGNPQKNITVYMWQKNTSGVTSLYDTEQTDFQGETRFYYDLNTQYSFKILNSTGSYLVNTNYALVPQSPRTLVIPFGLGPSILGKEYSIWQVRTQLYNVSTFLILKWDTLSGTSGIICMNVTHLYNNSRDIVGSACSSAPNGNMTFNFTGYHTGSIAAMAYVKGSTIVTNAINIVVQATSRLIDYIGTDGLIVYILLIVIAAGVALTNVQTIPFSLAIVHIIAWYMGIIPGSIATAICLVAALLLVMFRLEA